ncbi:hypothetical protein JHK82_014451 [Glycine max]|nr:hypothetical protein JHK82_014451 [Glycine max]
MATQPFRKAIAKPSSSSTPPIPNLSLFSSHHTPNLVINVIKNQNIPHHALHFFNWASNHNHYSYTPFCYAAISDLLISHSLFATPTDSLTTSLACSSTLSATAATSGAPFTSSTKPIPTQRMLCVLAEAVLEPDVYTYITMICGLCKVGMIKSARKVFEEMPCEPNMVTYNTLIHGFCKKGDMEGATRVFDRLVESKSCKPDVVSFATLIEGSCLSGEADEARKMMSRMRLNGLKDDVAINTSLLKVFFIVGKFDETVEHLREMVSHRMKPDVKAYGVVVNEYCKIRKPSEAVLLLREMVVRGVKPSMSCNIYNITKEMGI